MVDEKLNYSLVALCLLMIFFSCDEDNTEDHVSEGGLISVLTTSITHNQSSKDEYEVQLKIFQGAIKTTHIEVYKQYISHDGANVSEKILHETIAVSETLQQTELTFSFFFSELKSDIILNGNPLPHDDDLSFGDKIRLIYVAKTTEGNSHTAQGYTDTSISGRFAGTYVVTESDYWRDINAQSTLNDWVGVIRVIRSIDEETYEHVGLGPWTYDANDYYYHDEAFFFFNVDEEDRVTYYKHAPNGEKVVGLGTHLLTCDEDAGFFYENIPCDDLTNLAIRDDIEGKDQLFFTVGSMYVLNNDLEPPRIFYEALERL